MMKISGILLIIAGLSAIFCGGFSYKNHNQAPDMGLIQVDESANDPVRIPPIFGIAGIATGGGLVYFGRRQRR
ncbi:MAG: DUF3185 domain-containing protein [Terracidiphilus sp.]